ncbi:hypothetical protein [Aureimonas jatrophae]|uniref:Uncharacterized protein n=1 Tax=Aureimonas jatrophae TaxID=1166073 RepID=A0A1H0M3F2_9HYPH|nr:hypothetical protein [Aureimonas jatrophae]MBB3952640.1 hypothetical protein [Aureimonas jatrophae]SDO74905.1 hypothetical protein SAMN05192530_11252 [Aureimonas jatrophae]
MINATEAAVPPDEVDTALTVLKVFAIAGCNHFARVSSKVEGSDFYKTYRSEIVVDESLIRQQLTTGWVTNRHRVKQFLPMPFAPRPEYGEKTLIFFLRPYFFVDKQKCRIELIQMVDDPDRHTVGYRFEHGTRGNVDMHGYPHMQLTKKFVTGGVETSLTPTMAISHPVVPLPNGIGLSPLYSSLVSMCGHRFDGAKGLVPSFREMENGEAGAQVTAVADALDGHCRNLFHFPSGSPSPP